MLVKKSGTFDTSNRIYVRKRKKVWIFTLKMGMRSYVTMLQKNIFTQAFFLGALRKFSIHRMTMFNIFKRCAWHSLLRYRKNRERSTRQTDYMLGNVKKFGFSLWKWGWEAMGLCLKVPHFSLKTFFRKLLENFLFIVWPCSIYLKGAPNIVLYVNKKIGTVRHTNQKIFTKTRKKNVCFLLPFRPL